jgi:hypothetical protein
MDVWNDSQHACDFVSSVLESKLFVHLHRLSDVLGHAKPTFLYSLQ